MGAPCDALRMAIPVSLRGNAAPAAVPSAQLDWNHRRAHLLAAFFGEATEDRVFLHFVEENSHGRMRVFGLDELNGLRGRVDEVGLHRGQRLHTNRHRPPLGAQHRLVKRHFGPLPGVSRRHALRYVALFGRPEDHDTPTHVGAEIHQVTKVTRRAGAHGIVRLGQVQPIGLRQYPMNPRDGDARARGGVPDFLPLRRRDVGDTSGQGERGNLDRVVTGPGGAGEGVLDLPLVRGDQLRW